MDEESDYEEEEFLIFADFKNQLGSLELDENIPVKIIGLDSDPVAEVNGNIFKGSFDNPMGTCVFFEKDPDATPSDPLFETTCRQKYKYFAKTSKIIYFERVFAESKECERMDDTPDADNKKASLEKGDTGINQDRHERPFAEVNLQINMSYDEAIRKFQSFDDIR
ncbi:PREDICTED: uncharacterized protein LOC108380892 [Rhagoletis zephyria]|uniref:uncharacterized protein LOC108380892 n=1 Tax=Rhagoletis zephyria TaxID=28612 RepID=UPI0008117813|nr:PREDICTED: uncharacterized protein LOC108380892 [Rhagoletis zephyria]